MRFFLFRQEEPLFVIKRFIDVQALCSRRFWSKMGTVFFQAEKGF